MALHTRCIPDKIPHLVYFKNPTHQCRFQGRERNFPPPPFPTPWAAEPGSVMVRSVITPLPIPPPRLLVVKHQTISQTISFAPDFTVVNYWKKLPDNLAQILATGGKSTPYIVHIHSTHIKMARFKFCSRIFSQWHAIRKSPIPLPHLVNKYHWSF